MMKGLKIYLCFPKVSLCDLLPLRQQLCERAFKQAGSVVVGLAAGSVKINGLLAHHDMADTGQD
jgi:hypothetical protein